MKIAAAVILYHPDDTTQQRITSYVKFVNKLYVLDNTENNSNSFNLLKDVLNQAHVVYIHDNENKGISIRLNQAAYLAQQENCEWLLTMDQDSHFPDAMVPAYFNCIENYEYKSQTAMFGVQFSDKIAAKNICTPEEVPHLITSGSVINLSPFQKIGNFDEALFIDKVDHEYCLRARLFNYKTVQFSNIFLSHNLGKVSFGRSLKNFKLTPRVLHSPIRMYYILRNYLYLRSKYKGLFQESFNEMKKEVFNRTKNNLLYGNNKSQLLKYLLKGYSDYKSGKMGKVDFDN